MNADDPVHYKIEGLGLQDSVFCSFESTVENLQLNWALK